MATNPLPPARTIWEVADAFRADLLAREEQTRREMVRAWQPVRQAILRETGTLAQKIAARQAAGRDVPVSWLFGHARLGEWEQRVKRELAVWRSKAEAPVRKAIREAATIGPAQAMEMVAVRAIPFPELAARRLVRFPQAEVEQITATLQAGSPLTELLAKCGADTAVVMREALIRGVALGRGPVVMGREIGQALDGNMRRGLLIARTETMRTFREATRLAYAARPDVVDGWTWWSSRDRRTCVACWAMHGTNHTVQERLDGHPACRCTMIPRISGWQAGVEGPKIPFGERLFADLSPVTQRAILGPARHALYRNGARLEDMVARPVHPRWGPMRREANLRHIREANPAAAERAGAEREARRLAAQNVKAAEEAAKAAAAQAKAAAGALEEGAPPWLAALEEARAEVGARAIQGPRLGEPGAGAAHSWISEGWARQEASGAGRPGARLVELERLSTQAGELVDSELERRLSERGLSTAHAELRERTLVEMAEANRADTVRMLEIEHGGAVTDPPGVQDLWAQRDGFEDIGDWMETVYRTSDTDAAAQAFIADRPWQVMLDAHPEWAELHAARAARRAAQRDLVERRVTFRSEQQAAVREEIAAMLEQSGRPAGGVPLRFVGEAENAAELEVRRALQASADRLPRAWITETEATQPPLRVIVNEGGGGYHSRGWEPIGGVGGSPSTISVGAGNPVVAADSRYMSTAQHEYVHRLEDGRAHVKALEWAFYDRRTSLADGALEPVRSSSYSAPGVPAGSSFQWREDVFRRDYTGRIPYTGHNPGSSHEIATTGFESLLAEESHYSAQAGLWGMLDAAADGSGNLAWRAPDTDFRRFLLGLLFTG